MSLRLYSLEPIETRQLNILRIESRHVLVQPVPKVENKLTLKKRSYLTGTHLPTTPALR